MSLAETDAASSAEELKDLVRSGLLRTTFRPMVDLESDRVVGFEALHTSEGALRFPHEIRAAIRGSDMVGDLDAAARFFALETAASLGLLPDTRVFIDAEAESFATLEDRTHEADRSVVLQLGADTLHSRPAQLLRSIYQARSLGWGIAVAGVGVDFAGCAYLPLIDPAVICLDASLLRQGPSAHVAEVATLVSAHAERTGAIVVADGVATAEQLRFAKSLGAHVGRGDYFAPATGTPTVPEGYGHDDLLLHHSSRGNGPQLSPYSLAVANREPRRASLQMLTALITSLETRALSAGPATVVLSVFGEDEVFDAQTSARYRGLADSAAMVVVLAPGLDEPPVPGVRGGPLDRSDPVCEERSVVVICPEWSAVLTAKDLGDGGPEHERRFDFVLSYDPVLAIDAARSLMSRVPAERRQPVGGA